MTKPEFTVKIMNGGTVPSAVIFTDLIGNVTMWNFGDGVLGTWEEPKQRQIVHIYTKVGTFAARALADREESDPLLIVVKEGYKPPTPETLSWWQKLISWLKKLLGR
jgi:hypothetical protein